MPDARIDEIRTRTDVATPGHWGTHYDGKGTYTVEARPGLDLTLGPVNEGAVATLAGGHGDQQAYQDARFIAHAREDVPYLLGRVAELEAQLRNTPAYTDLACSRFPDNCPNVRTVPADPPAHHGGIRCGCADALLDPVRRRCAHTDVLFGQCVRYLDDHDGECQHEHQPAAGSTATVLVHACPGIEDNGISPCCLRPPFEFRGERLTRDPALVTCPGPRAEPKQGTP